METICSSEMSADFHRATSCYIPKDRSLQGKKGFFKFKLLKIQHKYIIIKLKACSRIGVRITNSSFLAVVSNSTSILQSLMRLCLINYHAMKKHGEWWYNLMNS
jgi:hypothetical protein